MHQRSGRPSYLFGEVRETGWWYYYLVALAVKVPLAFWLIVAARAALARRIPSAGRDWVLPACAVAFLAIASLGSTRNLGIRYLLPIAPLAIVWISGLAEGNAWARRLAWVGLAAQALAVASIHPYELSYFNALAGGPIGGRRILSDSNLDWGQGLKPLAELQREQPEFRDLTLFYFGDTEPRDYGVAGPLLHGRARRIPTTTFPASSSPTTAYLAVSASLQWGPWGHRVSSARWTTSSRSATRPTRPSRSIGRATSRGSGHPRSLPTEERIGSVADSLGPDSQ